MLGKDFPVYGIHVSNCFSARMFNEKLEAHFTRFHLIFVGSKRQCCLAKVEEKVMAGGTVAAFWAVSFCW